MAKENLLLLVNGADDNTAYAIFSQYGATLIDEFRYDKDKVATTCPWGNEYSSLDNALDAVLYDRNIVGEPQDLVIKAFKHHSSDGRIDVSRAWCISKKGDEYAIMSEVDGFAEQIKIEQQKGDYLTMPSLNTAIDFVSFLERVYSERNSQVGQKMAGYGMVCNKAVDILNDTFDANALKLLGNKAKEDVER